MTLQGITSGEEYALVTLQGISSGACEEYALATLQGITSGDFARNTF